MITHFIREKCLVTSVEWLVADPTLITTHYSLFTASDPREIA